MPSTTTFRQRTLRNRSLILWTRKSWFQYLCQAKLPHIRYLKEYTCTKVSTTRRVFPPPGKMTLTPPPQASPTPTVQSLKDDFYKIEEQYRVTDYAKNLSTHLLGELSGIKNVVMLGLGPVSVEEMDRPRWQLSFIRHLAKLIHSGTGQKVPIYSQENYMSLLLCGSSPLLNTNFPDILEEFLSAIGINALFYRTGRSPDSREVGPAFDKMTTKSLFYNPFCICSPIYLYLVEKDPQFYVGAGTLREIWKAAGGIDKTLEKVLLEEFEAGHDWEVLPGYDGGGDGWAREEVAGLAMYRRKQDGSKEREK